MIVFDISLWLCSPSFQGIFRLCPLWCLVSMPDGYDCFTFGCFVAFTVVFSFLLMPLIDYSV